MRLVGTKDPSDTATFVAAASGATPLHGGLFMPSSWPRFEDVPRLLTLGWRERCTMVLGRLIGDELDQSAIEAIVAESLDFPVPLVPLADSTFALELFHGPTLAFKDFGARFLAGVLARVPVHGPRTILTATSGDTGAAVASAFWRRPGVHVVVLYPHGRISPLQERQLACLSENVTALAILGSFDDCQALVKSCFADRELSRSLGLTSANSINIARLVAQTLYHFEAVAELLRRGVRADPVISVPSGNFGNLCAGLLAWKLGLPVRAFVAATNANDTVPRYLDGGAFAPRASVATLSSAMDVGAPSNWERIEALFAGNLGDLRSQLRWGRANDAETADAIRHLASLGYVACPHTAVAHRVLRSALHSGEVGIFLATAHPAKFGEVLRPILRSPPPLPARLGALLDLPIRTETLPNERVALVARLRRSAL